MDLKIVFLRKILEEKATLFGSFSNTLTKQDKRKMWEDITNYCHSLGVIPAAKDYTYLRDSYWPNIKKTTMAKVDNAKKTGSAGGRDKKLTAVDELVLEILGKDSPTVAGLQILDTMAETSEYAQAVVPDETLPDIEDPRVEPANKARKRKTIVMEGSHRHKELEELTKLKKKKLEAEIENIKLQNYKLRLDIYEKEKQLNIRLQDTEHSELLLLTEDYTNTVDYE